MFVPICLDLSILLKIIQVKRIYCCLKTFGKADFKVPRKKNVKQLVSVLF